VKSVDKIPDTTESKPMTNKKSALVFAPHPDDAELAMGGTIARLIEDGWDITVADLTDGEPTPAGSIEIRQKETAAASAALGITQRTCLNLPNRYLEETLEYRRVIAEAIRKYKPRWLFAPFRPDAHPDHVHAGQLIEDARFTAKLTKTDMAHEPHHPEKIIYYYATHLNVHPDPSFLLDVTDQWDKKLNAIKAYQSQFWLNQKDPTRQGWIIDQIEATCRYFGHRIGTKYAEPFFTHELTGLKTLNDLL
jgi:bacillithiol biosynthesis deacetylase BshB1